MSDGGIHRAAAEGFERAGGGDYEKGRPTYPRAVLETLQRECELDEVATVVDLGAGTGKFTRLLHERWSHVIAVEPVASMRTTYAQLFPGATVLEGTAEDLPVPERSVDLLTIAQAWHWFDPVPALDEISRALRSGGWLALVWNTRHPDEPWTDAINGVLDRLAGETPRFRSRDRRWRTPIEAHPAFDGELHEASFDNLVPMDLETMLARVASTSYVSALPDDERAAVLDEVADLVRNGPMTEQGPQFVERYRTELFWCRRR